MKFMCVEIVCLVVTCSFWCPKSFIHTFRSSHRPSKLTSRPHESTCHPTWTKQSYLGCRLRLVDSSTIWHALSSRLIKESTCVPIGNRNNPSNSISTGVWGQHVAISQPSCRSNQLTTWNNQSSRPMLRSTRHTIRLVALLWTDKN